MLCNIWIYWIECGGLPIDQFRYSALVDIHTSSVHEYAHKAQLQLQLCSTTHVHGISLQQEYCTITDPIAVSCRETKRRQLPQLKLLLRRRLLLVAAPLQLQWLRALVRLYLAQPQQHPPRQRLRCPASCFQVDRCGNVLCMSHY